MLKIAYESWKYPWAKFKKLSFNPISFLSWRTEYAHIQFFFLMFLILIYILLLLLEDATLSSNANVMIESSEHKKTPSISDDAGGEWSWNFYRIAGLISVYKSCSLPLCSRCRMKPKAWIILFETIPQTPCRQEEETWDNVCIDASFAHNTKFCRIFFVA